MTRNPGIAKILALLAILILAAPAFAADAGKSDAAAVSAPALPDRVLGQADAPLTVEEFVSLTCSHCAEFYNDTLPELEKLYVDTGKVKFILRDFPLDGVGLKAAVIARCMPADEFYPFVKVLYKNQANWAFSGGDPEKIMTQYARLGGLSEDKARACLADTGLQNAIVAERADAAKKYAIEATPTFVINNGAETIKGAMTADKFAAVFDRLLAAGSKQGF